MFKRRDKLSPLQWISRVVYPRGGWVRAVTYLKHRVRRLPDTPQTIARGVFCGVWVAFTPLFGLHVVLAIILARVLRGNMIAAVIATFVGNPVTYVPIAVVSLKLGHVLQGSRFIEQQPESIGRLFFRASETTKDNLWALVTGQPMDWTSLVPFWETVFRPFLIGSCITGAVAGLIAYYLCVPVIRAYQTRRRAKLIKRMKANLVMKRANALHQKPPHDKMGPSA